MDILSLATEAASNLLVLRPYGAPAVDLVFVFIFTSTGPMFFLEV